MTVANAYSGLPTHDQNPLLIPYWIPHTIASNGQTGLQISSSLFITNTLHDETSLNETLVIDAETYRVDINLQYEISKWVYHVQIPLISSSGGFMDDFIIKWHDNFGLPQGHRLQHPIDQINIQYNHDGIESINTQENYNGVGDLSFALTHPLFSNTNEDLNIGIGVNLPTGDNHTLISNNKIDSSVWISYLPKTGSYFFTFGLTKPGNGGVLKNQLKSSVIFTQAGIEFSFFENMNIQLQLDYHSSFIKTETDTLGDSLQMQFGLGLSHFKSTHIQLFFSEDILVNSAPDITFGLKIDWGL